MASLFIVKQTNDLLIITKQTNKTKHINKQFNLLIMTEQNNKRKQLTNTKTTYLKCALLKGQKQFEWNLKKLAIEVKGFKSNIAVGARFKLVRSPSKSFTPSHFWPKTAYFVFNALLFQEQIYGRTDIQGLEIFFLWRYWF